jgi:tetratricopeptide (TPR) repeat protein
MDELWERVRGGEHTAVLGITPGDPPPSLDARVVRVRCDVPPATLGPLDEARHKIERLLGTRPPLLGQARERVVAGIRRRMLGDVQAIATEGALVAAANRLAASSSAPAALVFEAVDAASDTTLAALRRIVARPGGLQLPLVLAFRGAVVEGAAAELLAALQQSAGPSAVLRAPAETRSTLTSIAATHPVADFAALPHEVLRVLRAGAIVGSGFEADLVAALLDTDTLAVLELVQRAADAGVPVEDRGEGRFHLAEPLLDALRASMLPSLMIAQHRRLAELLGGFGEDEAPAAPSGEMPESVPRPPAGVSPAASEPDPADPGEPSPGVWPYAEIFGGAAPATDPPSAPPPAPAQPREEEVSHDAAVVAPRLRPQAPVEPVKISFVDEPAASPPPPPAVASGARAAARPRADDARAAGHLAAAGDLDAGAERYLAAAQKAAASGACAQALSLAGKALAMLAALPESPQRRRLKARAMLEIGRLRWVTFTPDAGSTLAGAIETIDAARALLTAGDPAALRAEAAALTAAVCYDVGDAAALSRALDELTAASRILLDAGDSTGAARLLNDQAAVYVRMGDPVRATHLLGESRRIFESRADSDPVAGVEMAETDHLFARIPLHVPARPGRENDALVMGLDHALAAERTYRKLDARRELGRVWETMGRLELRRGRLDRARERLVAAVQIEESIGDLVGLARSTAALSELLAASGCPDEALGVLGDSVALNLEKGSPIGLAFNRRALDALARSPGGEGHAAALAGVERALAAAEASIGRMKLPGEGD